MKYSLVGLWPAEIKFIIRAIRGFLLFSAKKADQEQGEAIIEKLGGNNGQDS